MKMSRVKMVVGIALLGGLLLFGNGTIPANAAVRIESLVNSPVIGDYVVGPGKVELILDPGQSVTRNITVVNRFAKEKDFKLELEDFQGSKKPDSSIELLGLLKGPYSLKDYIKPEVMTFTLQPADRMTIPVTITIPKDAVPGGLYGSVIVTTQDKADEQATDPTAAQGAINVKSRVAILYFIRVRGDVKENGSLTDFTVDHNYYQKGPMQFAYSYANNGSVYEDPYGLMEVKNLYGTTVDQVQIQPYYVLPAAVRTNKISWDHGFMFGRYVATLKLNRGYNNQIDEKSVVFWVLPWKVIAPSLLFLILLLLLIAWLIKNVKIEFKKKEEKKDGAKK